MFAFLATLAQAGGIIIDKIILTRKRVELHVFIPILFIFLFFSTALLFPFLAEIKREVLTPYYLSIFVGMILVAIIWNFYYYRGVQAEKVHEFEMIVMFQPLLTIILAALFLEGERNIPVEIASVIAALALIVSHWQKKHLEISDGAWDLIWAVVFMSVELILIKILLDVFSPVALYFIRTGVLAVFFIIYYRPEIGRVANSNIYLILATSLLGTIQMIAKFYGFQQFGVIYTSLILILAPILVYIISTIWMHEHLKWRTTLCTAVILICIIYATLIG